jgi:hypothetical protein
MDIPTFEELVFQAAIILQLQVTKSYFVLARWEETEQAGVVPAPNCGFFGSSEPLHDR